MENCTFPSLGHIMNINDILPEAFLQGTGRSLHAARRSDHYQQLLRTFPRIPYLTTPQSVDMVFLGEQIADRAFLNLPVKFRHAATTWSQHDEATQEDILGQLFDTLGNQSLARRRSMNSADTNKPAAYLPHQYKSWARGKVIPNCLGMAQLLIGFGRATGAPIMLSTTLRRHDIATLRTQYLYWTKLVELIAPHSKKSKGIARLLEEICSYQNATMEKLISANYPDQAHHSLMLRTASAWWMIDPYFWICTPIKDTASRRTFDKIWRAANKDPRESTPLNTMCSINLQVRKEQDSLEWHLAYLNRFSESLSAWSIYESGVSLLRSFIEAAGVSPKSTEGIKAAAIYTKSFRAESSPGAQRSIWQEITRSQNNKHLRNELFVYFAEVFISAHIDNVFRLWDMPDLSQEYHHATLQLGVFTVNQVAVHHDVDIPKLSLYSRSQWILQNTIASNHTSEYKQFSRVFARNIRRVRNTPNTTLPSLRPFLEREEYDV